MSHIECNICFKCFNNINQKPINLPCGHVYCSSCIDKSISHGSCICPACRVSHGAESASDLPVNFYILNLLDDPLEEVSKQNEDSDEEFHDGSCPKHKRSILYFICRTHNVKACRECTVLDHRPGVCDVISFQDQLGEDKNDLITETNKQINCTSKTSQYIQYCVKENENEIRKKRNQVDCLLKEIEYATTKQDEAKSKVIKIDETQTDLETLKIELSSATKKHDIIIACEILRDKLKTAKKLENSTDLNFVLSETFLSKSPEEFLKIFQRNPRTVHVYQMSGQIRRSAELTVNDGKIHFNALSKEKKEPENSLVVQAFYILDLVIARHNESLNELQSIPLGINQARPEVFIRLTNRRKNILGTVYISVDPNTPYAKTFLDNFTGIHGSSYKGCGSFDILQEGNHRFQRNIYGIACECYMEESGVNGPSVIDTDCKSNRMKLHFPEKKNCIGTNPRHSKNNWAGNTQCIGQKGGVYRYAKSGFAILHKEPPRSSNQLWEGNLIGNVSSGLDIVCKIAANIEKKQIQAPGLINYSVPNNHYRLIYPSVNVDEVGVIIPF